jgi:hypothetical protein
VDYKGYELFDVLEPVGTSNLSNKNNINIIGKDYQRQNIHMNTEYLTVLDFTFECVSLEERFNLLQWFSTYKGAAGKFLMRSYKQDFMLAGNASAGDTSLSVKYTGDEDAFYYHEFLLYIEGHSKIYKVSGVNDNQDGNSTILHLTEGLTHDVKVNCPGIQICYLGRLENDTLTFDLDDINYSTATLKFMEVSSKEFAESLA